MIATNDMTTTTIDITDSLTVLELDCKIHRLICCIRQNSQRKIDDKELRSRFFDLVLKWEKATGLLWSAMSKQLYFERSTLVNFYMSQDDLRPLLASHRRGEMVGDLLHQMHMDQTHWLRMAVAS